MTVTSLDPRSGKGNTATIGAAQADLLKSINVFFNQLSAAAVLNVTAIVPVVAVVVVAVEAIGAVSSAIAVSVVVAITGVVSIVAVIAVIETMVSACKLKYVL
jgi:hypothetical protein